MPEKSEVRDDQNRLEEEEYINRIVEAGREYYSSGVPIEEYNRLLRRSLSTIVVKYKEEYYKKIVGESIVPVLIDALEKQWHVFFQYRPDYFNLDNILYIQEKHISPAEEKLLLAFSSDFSTEVDADIGKVLETVVKWVQILLDAGRYKLGERELLERNKIPLEQILERQELSERNKIQPLERQLEKLEVKIIQTWANLHNIPLSGNRISEEVRSSLDLDISKELNQIYQLLDDITQIKEPFIQYTRQGKIGESDIETTLHSLRKYENQINFNQEYQLHNVIFLLIGIYNILKIQLQTSIDTEQDPAIKSTLPIRLPMKTGGEVVGRGTPQTQEARTTGDTPPLIPIPPYTRLHQEIEQAKAYQLLNNPTRIRLLQTYLTTDKTFSDIQREEGFKSVTGVADNVKKSLEIIFPHLPEAVRNEYKSPKEAVRLKSAHHTDSSLQRMRQGWERLRRQAQETGERVKAEFTQTHRQHITDANLQRWERDREARRASQTEDQE